VLAVTCSPEDEADAEMWWEDHEHASAAGTDLAADSADSAAAQEQQVEVRCGDVHLSWRRDVAMHSTAHADILYKLQVSDSAQRARDIRTWKGNRCRCLSVRNMQRRFGQRSWPYRGC